MAGDVRITSGPLSTMSGAARRRRNRTKILAALGIVACALVAGGGVFAWKHQNAILRMVHRTPPPPPPPPAMVAEFAPFKTLQDFKGVECFYTATFVESLPAVHEPAPVNLVPMSRVVVQQILRESGDYDHPSSSGYRLLVMTRNAKAAAGSDHPGGPPVKLLDTLLVLYPVIGNHEEVIELHLCPVIAFKKAKELWLDRSFKYAGSQIGGMDIDPGTIISVTDVSPANFGISGVAFDLALRLPSGQTVHQLITPDNMGLLQPVDQ